MAEEKRKILVLVEGAKTDVALMEWLLSAYQIDIKYEIVSYCTNIYTLYHEMFEDNDPADMDLLQLQKNVLLYLVPIDYLHTKIYQPFIIKLVKNLEKKLELEDIYLGQELLL